MKNFQIILIAVFILTAILGVLVFAGIIPLGKNNSVSGAQGTIVLWGTVKAQVIQPLIDDFNRIDTNFTVKYIEKSPDTYDEELLEAFASGKSPDMFFITDDLVFKYSNKIFTISYQSFPLATFKNTFVGAGDIFLSSKGILAFPITVDPLMMYYNRGILNSNGVANPPSYWDEFADLIPFLTKKDNNGIITKSTIAMGQFSNILHAKDIISTLFLQSGDPIVTEKNGSYLPVFGQSGGEIDPASILKFYTDFADPLKDVYSWNRSFPNSQDMFSREDLAFYFGFASELKTLVNKNPNEDFLVAAMPQIRNNNFKVTFGHMTGIAISSSSKNLNSAFVVAGLLSNNDDFISKLTTSLGMAPARLSLLKNTPADAFSPAFYSSAFFTKNWVDPSPKDTNDIFQNMIEKVLSNSLSLDNAIADTNTKIRFLLVK